MFCTMFPQHPSRVKIMLLYPATSLDLVTPTLTTMDKFAADTFMSQVMRPFYALGNGVALCAVCLTRRSRNSGVAEPAFYAREDYIQHFKNEHWNFSVLSGLHSPTQWNTRMYLAMFLYTLCLAHLPSSQHPRKPACNDPGLFPGLSTSTILRNLTRVPENDLLGELCTGIMDPGDQPIAGCSAPAGNKKKH
jgi:hypothetical protein